MKGGAELEAWAAWLEHGLAAAVKAYVVDEEPGAYDRLAARIDAAADAWLPLDLFAVNSPREDSMVTVREQVKRVVHDVLNDAAVLRMRRHEAQHAEAITR